MEVGAFAVSTTAVCASGAMRPVPIRCCECLCSFAVSTTAVCARAMRTVPVGVASVNVAFH